MATIKPRAIQIDAIRFITVTLTVFLGVAPLTPSTPLPLAHAAGHEAEEAATPLTTFDAPDEVSALANVVIGPERFQTIVGFGVSSAWVGGHLYYSVDAQHQQEVLDMLFTNAGLGLSILRTKVEPDVAKKGYNDGQEWVMKQAQQRGVTQFYSTPWTPPAEWEDSKNRLLPEYYDEYANFLADYVTMYQGRGITIRWLSVQNEPDLDCEYESCVWTERELDCFVPLLRDTLNSRGLSWVRLLAPEAMGWSQTDLYLDALDSSGYDRLIDVVATHGYWGDTNQAQQDYYREHVKEHAAAHGQPVWMTEWSDLDTVWTGQNLSEPAVFGIDDGLKWAGRIANDLVRANTSAWLYWWMYNPNPFPNRANEGIIVRTASNDFLYPKRFYAMAQFSRFVRPGAQRLGVTGIPSGLSMVAFRSHDLQSVVLVVVNPNSSAASFTLDLTAYNTGGSAQVFRTSAAENVAALPAQGLQNGLLATTAAAKSVTTFIIPAVEGPPAAPSGLTVATQSQTQLNLSWVDNSTNETGFRIERSPNGTSNWQEIASVGANVTRYQNTGLNSDTRYFYRVRAYRAQDGQFSAYSPVANGCTMAQPVKVNEVFIGAANWIEIKNAGSAAVTLTGWRAMAYKNGQLIVNYAFPNGFTLPAGGYVLLAEGTSGSGLAVQPLLYLGTRINWTAADGGAVALTSASGAGADFVRWGCCTLPPPSGTNWLGDDPPAPDGVQSLARKWNIDTDRGSDWNLQSASPAADNAITEFKVFVPLVVR